MASIIWTSVLIFLVCELVVTFILVVPVPQKIRNMIARQVFKLKLSEILHKPLWFIAIGLCMAFMDSFFTLERITQRAQQEHHEDLAGASTYYHHGYEHDRVYHDLDKQRGYKAQRNMYLTGFALTLLFVIGRIIDLMQESVVMEERMDHIMTKTNSGGGSATTTAATISCRTATTQTEPLQGTIPQVVEVTMMQRKNSMDKKVD